MWVGESHNSLEAKGSQERIDPDIIFLMETKKSSEFVKDKLDSLNFESKFHVPPRSTASGGLSLYWNSCIEIKVIEACDNFIDAEIIYKKNTFFSTFTYGAPEAQNRRITLSITLSMLKLSTRRRIEACDNLGMNLGS